VANAYSVRPCKYCKEETINKIYCSNSCRARDTKLGNKTTFDKWTPEERKAMYALRSSSESYKANIVIAESVREIKLKDPEWSNEFQQRATRGRLNSSKFRDTSRKTLARFKQDPIIEEKRKNNQALGMRGALWGRTRSIPTTYEGIKFRSRSEARFAELMDLMGKSWQYEPTVFKFVDEKGTTRRYIPDFYLPDLKLWFEIKGFEYNGLRERLDRISNQNNLDDILVFTSHEIEESIQQTLSS